MIRRDIPGLPDLSLPAVDVRDCAKAHLLALKKPGISGERFLISLETISMLDLTRILDEELRQYGYRVQTRRIGYCLLKLASLFDG